MPTRVLGCIRLLTTVYNDILHQPIGAHMSDDAFSDAIKKAKAEGHELVNDPPMAASVARHTCKLCGYAVLGTHRHAYGSATEGPCKKKTNVG